MTANAWLTIDNVEISASRVLSLVDQAVSGLASVRAPSWRGVGCRSGDPLSAVVTFLAAQRAGVPAFMDMRAPVGPAARPGSVLRVEGDAVRLEPVAEPSLPLPEDTEVVFQTSGSSGNPKQVAHSREAMEYQARATSERVRYTDEDRLLVLIPPGHAYGYSLLRIWQRVGTGLHLHRGFSPERVCRALARHSPTSLDGVPSHYATLLRIAHGNGDVAKALTGLRVRGCGGDILPRSVSRPFLDRFGAPVHDGYGLTEAGPNVAINAPYGFRPNTVGRPLDGMRVRIASGEIQVQGPSVIREYCGGGPANAPRTQDGWLRTGDIGTLDAEGYLHVVGRRKEVIITHGETVAPRDVEEMLAESPWIAECAVLGVPSGTARGDRILAFVVPPHGSEGPVDHGRLRDSFRRLLPPRLRPAHVYTLEKLPRLPSGKLDRGELRALARTLAARAGRPGGAR